MSDLPTGTLTFVFTDIEGSTPIWETAPDEAAMAMAVHDRLLHRSLDERNGTFVKGTGDGMLAVFPAAADALAAAVEFQIALLSDSGLESPPSVRVALHTGQSLVRRGDYYGLAPAQCHRVLSAIHGGQICLTADTRNAIGGDLPKAVRLRDLGQHRLRGISAPVRLFHVEHPQLPSDFPPLRAVEVFEHNLPTPLTSFVGRTSEVDKVAALLGESRMVTVIGAGGSGKSRLAVELGTRLVDEFHDGVWIVELAALSEADLVARTIGHTLGVPEERGRSDLDSLVHRLSDRRPLLILDNCDHLVEACSDVAERLLAACPGLTIMATSRQRVGVPGEVVLALSPMSVPEPEDLHSPEAVARADSVQLFVERAELSSPEFRLTSRNCPHVGRICRAVEGIPLAIELAVGRLRSLPLDQIASHLENRIQLLSGGMGSDRHETLEQTLDWSYGTLSQAERELFGDLSVFRGGFEMDGVERIFRTGNLADAADVLGGLIEKSMITRDHPSGRYRYLEPIRLYAWGMLEDADRTAGLQLWHALYVAEIVAAETGSEGNEQARWMDRVMREHDNIRAALRWGLETGEGDLALRISGNVWPFWKYRGHVTEGRDWLDRSIGLVGESHPPSLERALLGAGDLAATQDDRVVAERYLTRVLLIAERMEDDVGTAAALSRLASLPHREGDLPEATKRFEEALVVARRGGDLPQIAGILASLALLVEDQGRVEEAETYAAEALSLRRKIDDLHGVSDALLTLGEISINRGRYVEAREALEDAFEIASRSGFQDVIAWSTGYLGKLELVEGNHEEGMHLLQDSLLQFQERGQPNGTAWAMRHLGQTALARGDLDRAAALLREALDTALEHVVPDAPLVLEAMGQLEVARGNFETAAFLLGAADRARNDTGLVISPSDRQRSLAALAAAESALATERFVELRARGNASSLDELPVLLVGGLATRR